MKNLFVEVIGQHDNVGDSMLRRGMLDSIRHPAIQLHVQVGGTPDGYVSGLGLGDADVIYRSRREWSEAIGAGRSHGSASFLANAGEVIRVRGPRYLRPKLLAKLASLRQRGGALLHTGVGVRDLDTRAWLAKTSALRFFDLVTWRDAASRDYAGIGEVQPDWGFATDGVTSKPHDKSRDILAVSIRGDRARPDDAWQSAVRELANGLNLRIVTFSQVARDTPLAEELGRTLDADDVVTWTSEDHATQEERVRALFRRSACVVSDRLHGLILGATEGAYPVGMPPLPNAKSLRTLAPVGFPRHVATIHSLHESIDALGGADLAHETRDAVARARRALMSRAREIADIVLAT